MSHRKKSQLVGRRLGGLLPDLVVGPARGNTSTERNATARRIRSFGTGALSSEGAHKSDLPERVVFRSTSTENAKTRMVTFPGATEKGAGFLALPRYPNRGRAIIVFHEWWGLNKWVKKQATNLAANGYVALAVDLHQGKLTSDPSEARKLKRGLPRDRAVRDLKAAFDYLARRPDVDPKHIGSLGWSMGGGLALQLAIHEPRLAACVVNYGPLPTDIADIQKIDAQVLGIFRLS